MDYKITTIVEDEEGNIICELSTSAGIEDFQENIIRKVEHSIKKYEDEMEAGEQMEIDRQTEDEEYGVKN